MLQIESKKGGMIMATLSPANGGCWFCHKDNEQEALLFDWEFDTFVHANCIRKALKEDPLDREAILMKYLLENSEQAKADTDWINEQCRKENDHGPV
jgi:predicted transcriptional regulator